MKKFLIFGIILVVLAPQVVVGIELFGLNLGKEQGQSTHGSGRGEGDQAKIMGDGAAGLLGGILDGLGGGGGHHAERGRHEHGRDPLDGRLTIRKLFNVMAITGRVELRERAGDCWACWWAK